MLVAVNFVAGDLAFEAATLARSRGEVVLVEHEGSFVCAAAARRTVGPGAALGIVVAVRFAGLRQAGCKMQSGGKSRIW